MRESDVVLDTAFYLETILQRNGFDVRMSRRSDVNAGSQAVWQAVNAWNADCYIDLHCNAFSNPSANGYETFYPANKPQDRLFAQYIHSNFLRHIKIRDRGIKPDGQTQHSGGIGRLRNVNCPACLPELAFISAHPTQFPDVPLLRVERAAMAWALAAGIMAYFSKEPCERIADTPHDEISLCTLERECDKMEMNVNLVINGTRHENAGGIIEGRTFVPARLIAETLNKYVQWDEASRTVTITTPEALGESGGAK